MIRIITITTLLIGLLSSGCMTTPEKFEYTDGLKMKTAKLPKDAILIGITKEGNRFLLDVDGNVAKECKTPKDRTKKEKQNYKPRKGECTGIGINYISRNIVNGVIINKPNPHGCVVCYDLPSVSGTWYEKCYPDGCKTQDH